MGWIPHRAARNRSSAGSSEVADFQQFAGDRLKLVYRAEILPRWRSADLPAKRAARNRGTPVSAMLNDPSFESRTGLRTYVAVSLVAFVGVALYVGWVFYARREANQAILDRAAEKERSQDQKTFEAMGGNRFDILSYSANPATVAAGEKTSLCYSVSNAKSVTIEPSTEEPVWPAFSRCVHVSPHKTTKYTLTVGDDAGHTKIATVEVYVR